MEGEELPADDLAGIANWMLQQRTPGSSASDEHPFTPLPVEELAAAFPDRMEVPQTLRDMVELGLLGRKVGKGFYIGKKPNTNLASGTSQPEITHRLVGKLRSEAERCLEEGIAKNAADINLAMTLGTGYPPFRTGILPD